MIVTWIGKQLLTICMQMNLNEAIQYYPNIIDPKKCSILSDYAELAAKKRGPVVDPKNTDGRKVFAYDLTQDNVQDNLYRDWVKSYITQTLSAYSTKFKFLDVHEICGIQLLRYPVGNYYKTHVDFCKGYPRNISLIFNLNNDYIGGQLYFTDQNEKLSTFFALDTGDVICFPSNYLYPHGVLPIKKGTRYSIVAWMI